MSGNSPLFAAIDLGSNSFHMLVVRNVEGAVRAVSRVKRKVRLASGLDENNVLSDEAINRGLDCLKLFAEQLENIPVENVRIVGTATLRIAKNVDVFLEKAEKILNQPIEIISGETEAKTIYYGVISTSSEKGNTLVLDIGGASTELIIGEQKLIKVLHSTQMGCVTWCNRYFNDNLITKEHYTDAINAANKILEPYKDEYLNASFNNCLGASGTIQALQEIMSYRLLNEIVTIDILYELRDATILAGSFDKLQIEGLTPERLTVFPSGLAILIAIFESLNIKSMSLAGGALREGLIYSMLGKSDNSKDNRTTTLDSLIIRYQIDREQANRVNYVSQRLFNDVKKVWEIDNEISQIILKSAAMLYEIGLCIEYKNAPQHAAYIINNIDMPGFTLAQKHLISALLFNERDDFKLDVLRKQNAVSFINACNLARLLRIAIILSMRRSDDVFSREFMIKADSSNHIKLIMPKGWFDSHYLRYCALKEEAQKQKMMGWVMELGEEQ
ncbi:MAG: guanosine-5'-triphosphate,3'-diphosphate diphosphatase [Succinivibrionaceae bacterium]|nr:guanosine-5'-triphosphate,3'-diphosphate diphosphatase [Succinivibrionaceae bacterium]